MIIRVTSSLRLRPRPQAVAPPGPPLRGGRGSRPCHGDRRRLLLTRPESGFTGPAASDGHGRRPHWTRSLRPGERRDRKHFATTSQKNCDLLCGIAAMPLRHRCGIRPLLDFNPSDIIACKSHPYRSVFIPLPHAFPKLKRQKSEMHAIPRPEKVDFFVRYRSFDRVCIGSDMPAI